MSNIIKAAEPRPVARSDKARIMAFARDLPDHDLLFLTRDLRQEKVVDAWLDAIDEGWIHSQIIMAGDSVAGYNALVNDPLSWSPHLGEIRVTVGEKWRNHGVGKALALAALNKAIELDLDKLIARMTTDQHGAVTLFEQLGFRGEALLRDHVRDKAGKTYDLAILSLDMKETSMRHQMMGYSGS